MIVVPQSYRGKGDALACGCAMASGDIIVMMDADGSTDPAEIPLFVEALIDGADFAKGSRYLPDGGSEDLTFIRRSGNAGLTGLVNLLFGARYTDLCYGYNAFWRDCLTSLNLDSTGLRDRDPAQPESGQGRPGHPGGAERGAQPHPRREQPPPRP